MINNILNIFSFFGLIVTVSITSINILEWLVSFVFWIDFPNYIFWLYSFKIIWILLIFKIAAFFLCSVHIIFHFWIHYYASIFQYIYTLLYIFFFIVSSLIAWLFKYFLLSPNLIIIVFNLFCFLHFFYRTGIFSSLKPLLLIFV